MKIKHKKNAGQFTKKRNKNRINNKISKTSKRKNRSK